MNNVSNETQPASLYFWGVGDMHYRALPAWRELHTPRLQYMYDDLRLLWEEKRPAFCVSPGDIVDTCALENHQFARQQIEAELFGVPFYPGVGNHEYYGPDGEDLATMMQTFEMVWQRPQRYAWLVGGVICVMLDYPNPHLTPDPTYISISGETLAFLTETLEAHRHCPAVVFLHSPLRNTVLYRSSSTGKVRDYNSTQNFFSPENSQEVRDILACHERDILFISGHVHAGWGAPDIVKTEKSAAKAITYVNLMSPWYTGNHGATRFDQDQQTFVYTPDDPNLIVSFSFQLESGEVHIQAREHNSRRWLKDWRFTFA
ncbi:metallophosphoesterase family protein [Ktedonospora formicarum]|uniref:Calcineurin-like phosphoesterase domain-containing protein n=1 Tax=Ktedonospora formicarum TaxID=2778364 RepID=A0A8J3MRS9_9CHLR|nr:metallophosphoesterase [Ktedonospora formicarum]GHO44126.1 hypothetical protein KSX_22890 [Ktedonospora formicarum]